MILDLDYQRQGSGEPLVITHGLFGSRLNWRSVAEKLAEHFDVINVDLRNHGDSPHAPEHNYSVMARDVLALLDHLGLERAHILGHSMGGKLGMVFAANWPERLHSLMVVDIAPRDYPPLHDYIFDALRAVDFREVDSRKDVEAELAEYVPEPPVRQFLLTNLVRRQGRLGWKLNLETLYANYDALNAMPALAHPFAGPALFIRGGNSDYVRESDREPIHRHFPAACIKTFPNVHHWPHIEAPVAFLRTVIDFARDPRAVACDL